MKNTLFITFENISDIIVIFDIMSCCILWINWDMNCAVIFKKKKKKNLWFDLESIYCDSDLFSHWPLRERLGEVPLLFGVLTVGPPRAPENSLSIEESPLAANKKENKESHLTVIQLSFEQIANILRQVYNWLNKSYLICKTGHYSHQHPC